MGEFWQMGSLAFPLKDSSAAPVSVCRKLRRLDVSSLPRLENPGLARILLEEMLPFCEVSGAEYEQGLIQTPEQDPETETRGDGALMR